MKIKTLLVLSTALLCAGSLLAAPPEGFTPLFDGQTLKGWEGDEKIFRVEEGAIVAGTLKEKIAHNEFLCTEKEFGNFELRLKFKVLGEGANAGVQFRTKSHPGPLRGQRLSGRPGRRLVGRPVR